MYPGGAVNQLPVSCQKDTDKEAIETEYTAKTEKTQSATKPRTNKDLLSFLSSGIPNQPMAKLREKREGKKERDILIMAL